MRWSSVSTLLAVVIATVLVFLHICSTASATPPSGWSCPFDPHCQNSNTCIPTAYAPDGVTITACGGKVVVRKPYQTWICVAGGTQTVCYEYGDPRACADEYQCEPDWRGSGCFQGAYTGSPWGWPVSCS